MNLTFLDDTSRQEAVDIIESFMAGGGTDIGVGVEQGLDVRKFFCPKNPFISVIIFRFWRQEGEQ